MSDIFGGIFDSIGSLLDDDVIKAVGKAGVAISGSSQSQGSMSQLDYGKQDGGINTNFNSTKTGAVESVSPDQYEAAWKARLKRFAEVEGDSSVKLKG